MTLNKSDHIASGQHERPGGPYPAVPTAPSEPSAPDKARLIGWRDGLGGPELCPCFRDLSTLFSTCYIYCKLSFEFMYYIVYNFISCIYDLCFMTYIHATLYVLYLTIYVVYDLLYATLCWNSENVSAIFCSAWKAAPNTFEWYQIVIQMPCHISESSHPTRWFSREVLPQRSPFFGEAGWVRSLQLWPCSGFLDWRTFLQFCRKTRGEGVQNFSHREHIPTSPTWYMTWSITLQAKNHELHPTRYIISILVS